MLGEARDWKDLAHEWAKEGHVVRSVDLWRFLSCRSMDLWEVGVAVNGEVVGNGQLRQEDERYGMHPPERGAEKRVLLGYSMGGRIALHALLDDAERVRSGEKPLWDAAVMISAHPGLESEEDRSIRRSSDAEWAGMALKGDWDELLEKWNAQGVLQGGQSSQDRSRLRLRRHEIARAFVVWSLGTQNSLWDRLGEIVIPVRWVVGEGDAKFRVLAERAVERLPQAKLDVVAEAGHRVAFDHPEEVRKIVVALGK